jgi:Na+-driven multidrug efflux pump
MLSNFHGIKDSQGYQKIFWLNLIISTISAIIIALPIILFAPWFMARFGLAFKVGSSTLVLLCIAAILMAALDGIGPSIVSEGKMWFGLILNFIWGIVMLVASYILRKNGAIGLATATLIAYSVHLLTSSIYVKYRMSKWQLS